MCERCEPRSHSISRWSMPLDCTENAYKNSTWLLNCHFLQTSLYGPTQWPLYTFDVHSVKWQTLQTATWNSDRLSSFCCCNRRCHAKHRGPSPSYIYANYTSSVALRRLHFYRCIQKTKSTIFTNLLTDRTQTYTLPRRSRKMVILLGHWRQQQTTNDILQKTTHMIWLRWLMCIDSIVYYTLQVLGSNG